MKTFNIIKRYANSSAALMSIMLLFSLPANAQSYDIPGYHIQLLPPPPGAAEFTQAWGLNNKGIVVGNSDSGDGGSWLYDTKTGAYAPVNDFLPITINNNGVMGGTSLDGNCAIRDKNGDVTEFSTPTLEVLGEPCDRSVRAISENGKAVGFERLYPLTPNEIWFGFVYDSNTGVTEEFLANPFRTIAHGISNKGTIVGTTVADDGDRAAFVRDKDGSVQTFRATNPDVIDPRLTNARGISDNGKVISGFYFNTDFEAVAFIVDSSALSGAGNSDVEVTPLEIGPCDPDNYSPPTGYLGFTDSFAYEVRNDGVILGNCGDYYWDPVTDPNFENLIFDFGYTFIATPIK